MFQQAYQFKQYRTVPLLVQSYHTITFTARIMLQTFQQCGKLKTRDKMRVPTKHLVQNHSCQRRAKRRRTPFFITNSFTQQVNTLLGYKDWQCKPIWTNLSRDLNCPSWLILSEVMKLRSFTAFSSLVAVRKSAVQAPLARQEKKKAPCCRNDRSVTILTTVPF